MEKLSYLLVHNALKIIILSKLNQFSFTCGFCKASPSLSMNGPVVDDESFTFNDVLGLRHSNAIGYMKAQTS